MARRGPPLGERMMFALRAARVFDGRDLLDEPIVAVDGSVIVAVGRDVPPGLRVEDLGPTTLMPGLVDCHQHLCFDGNGTLEQQVAGVPDHVLLDRATANATRAVHAGITTIRDLGDRGFVTLGLDGPDLPTILASGPPLTAPGGHCWFLGGECDGRDAIVAAVHERHERGCHVVKIMVTGGAHTPTFPLWTSQFDAGDLAAAISTAHGLGLPVAAHCHGIEGTAMAVAAGVDTIEHCTFFTASGRSEPDDELIAAIARAGIPVSATLGRIPTHVAPPIIEENLARVLHGLRRLRDVGGVVTVGTDAGIAPGKPHDILPFAVEPLTEIGIDGVELLATLTSVAARAIGVGERKGRLAAGYDADLLVVDGDPTTTPQALRSVRAVWASGGRIR